MNRYPVWKYIVIVIALLFGVIYTLPNFFGESPALQISSAKATVKVDNSVTGLVEDALKKAGVPAQGIVFTPEGASSGGRIGVASGPVHAALGVDWLTGRVSVAGD